MFATMCKPAISKAVLIIAGTIVFLMPPSESYGQADVRDAIGNGVAFIRKSMDSAGTGYPGGANSLGAYAMIKGGASKDDPVVKKIINGLVKSLEKGKYVGSSIYAAGCELMLLEAARKGRDDYSKEMQLIVDHIIKNQHKPGYWNYGPQDMHGDTSVTQFAVLGLWAAERAEIDFPRESLERAVQWLLATQGKTGGFKYRPTSDERGETLSVTLAGTATLLICQSILYPNQELSLRRSGRTKPKKPTGGLEDVEIEPPAETTKPGEKKKPAAKDYKPTIPAARILGAARGGFGWINARYEVGGGLWPMYAMYATERAGALANIDVIAGKNWYRHGADYLVRTQAKDGSWNSRAGKIPATSFGILFLSRTTGQLLNRVSPDFLGGGLLRGGVGLPTDLSALEEGKDGKIKKKKIVGPIDELLTELMKPKSLEVGEVQQAIVEKIQIGDRKQWLKPERRKQLLRMAQHPDPKVRQVAVWALGRTGNVDVAKVLVDALENDPDLNVAIDAREGLCWISRKPQGFGLPATPDTLVPDGAGPEERLRVVTQWRSDVVKQWKKWYLTVRPYSERDDLQEFPER